jgi:hypothetical protein
VTLNLIKGFSFGRPVWYIPMDSSDPTVSAIEGATYAPLLGSLPTGSDDSFSSPIERIFIAETGASDCNIPQRRALDAPITDEFRPNNPVGEWLGTAPLEILAARRRAKFPPGIQLSPRESVPIRLRR